MEPQSPAAPRGNPPNRDQLAERLKDALPLWNEVRETVLEIGATWKWAYSDTTRTWSYRSCLSGDRFFASLTPTDGGFEVSLNLKADEWAGVTASSPAEEAQLAALRGQAEGKADELAWLHVPVTGAADLPLLAKILVARARRVQKPRMKAGKKR